MWHVNFFKCVSLTQQIDPAAATRYEHNEDVLCRGGERQAWAWTDGIQSQLLSALTQTPPPGPPADPGPHLWAKQGQ